MTTYQDVVAANLATVSYGFAQGSGLIFPPWRGTGAATGHGTFSYLQPGPFATAEAIKANTSGYVTVPFPAGAPGPWTAEFWLKLNASPPAVASNITGTGNTSSNGTGIYINTDSHWHFVVHGGADTDIGILVTDTNWHVVEVGHDNTNNASVAVAVDGIVRAHIPLTSYVTANPAAWGFLSDAAGNNGIASASLTYVSIYPLLVTPQLAASAFVASTDPTAALAYTAVGANQDILSRILAAVSRTFPTT